MNKKFTFYKENKIDQEFSIDIEDLKHQFVMWIYKKRRGWLDYYAMELVSIFITDKEGLNSVFVYPKDLEILEAKMLQIKWETLEKLKI